MISKLFCLIATLNEALEGRVIDWFHGNHLSDCLRQSVTHQKEKW